MKTRIKNGLGKQHNPCPPDPFADALLARTNVLVAYSALLQRAATHQDISLQTGTLLESVRNTPVVKDKVGKAIPKFITKDALDTAVNGIVDALASRARANALERAVRTANPIVQRLADDFDYYFGKSDVCTDAVSTKTNTPLQWCAVFDAEQTLLEADYGQLLESRMPFAGDFRPQDPKALRISFSALVTVAKQTGNFTPAASAYGDLVRQVRARAPQGVNPLQSLAAFNDLERAGRAAARRRDAARLTALYEAALKTLEDENGIQVSALNDPVRARLDADIKGLSASLAAGPDFATAVRAFAAEHAHVLALIDEPVPNNTAVLDR